jgi:hypothetical protein
MFADASMIGSVLVYKLMMQFRQSRVRSCLLWVKCAFEDTNGG